MQWLNALTEDAQVTVLAGILGIIGIIIGSLLTYFFTKREFNRRKKEEEEKKRLEQKIVRSATWAQVKAEVTSQHAKIKGDNVWAPKYRKILIRNLIVLILGIIIINILLWQYFYYINTLK